VPEAPAHQGAGRPVLSRVCYLPASKRKPQDTYWTLTGSNMVHTEFPNHQENVRRMAEEPAFKLADYAESITAQFPPEVLAKLSTLPDFRRGYELNAELSQVLREAGIAGSFGTEGHTPAQWPEYGSVQKTLAEFKAAYDTFRGDMLGLFRAAAGPAAKAAGMAKAERAKQGAAASGAVAKKPAKQLVKKAPKAAAKKRAARR
jgi:hypothetical protein